MILLGILLGMGILGAIIYMAVDKKSTFIVRLASLIALGLMILTIIICIIMVFTDNRVPVDESILIVGAPVETKKDSGHNIWVLMMIVIVLISIFFVIILISMKENRKHLIKSGQDNKKAAEKFKL